MHLDLQYLYLTDYANIVEQDQTNTKEQTSQIVLICQYIQ